MVVKKVKKVEVKSKAVGTKVYLFTSSTCTLGALDEVQILDDIGGTTEKRWMLHYNFQLYFVGELGRLGTPGRREIGHRYLGERALSYIIPSK